MSVSFPRASKPKTFTPSKAERDAAAKIVKERSTPRYIKGEIARLEEYAKGLTQQRGVSQARSRMVREQIAVELKKLKAQLALAERRIVKPAPSKTGSSKPDPAPAANTGEASKKTSPDTYSNKGKPSSAPNSPQLQTKA